MTRGNLARSAGACPGGDLIGEVGGVVVDEAEQGRAAGVLPGQAEEVQPGDIGDAAPVDDAARRRLRRGCRSRSSRTGSRSPRSPRRRPGCCRRRTGRCAPRRRPGAGRNRTPARWSRRRLVPMMNSPRACSRRPSRESAVTRMRPSRVSHQNRSLPSRRCGSIGAFVADRQVDLAGWRRVPRRSGSRSCRRRRPAPARAAGPAGCGSRRCGSGSPSRPSRGAAGGTNGTWNGPVATTTCRARKTSSPVRTSKPSPVRLSAVTRALSRTGRSNAVA